MFNFDNYSKLRSREGWADLKFVSFSRDELAAGMRKHTKDPIHDPLTEISDPKQVKIAKNMFKVREHTSALTATAQPQRGMCAQRCLCLRLLTFRFLVMCACLEHHGFHGRQAIVRSLAARSRVVSTSLD